MRDNIMEKQHAKSIAVFTQQYQSQVLTCKDMFQQRSIYTAKHLYVLIHLFFQAPVISRILTQLWTPSSETGRSISE